MHKSVYLFDREMGVLVYVVLKDWRVGLGVYSWGDDLNPYIPIR